MMDAPALLGGEHGVRTPVSEMLQRHANEAARTCRTPGFMTPGQVLAAAVAPKAGRRPTAP